MKENIETKDVQRTEYLDKNGLDMLWAKVKENTQNQVEVERNRAVAKENSIIDTKADKSEFSNYVPSATFTALEKKVSANTAAISNKQNAGNYLHYETLNDEGFYEIPNVCISDIVYNLHHTLLDPESLQIVTGDLEANDTTGIVIASNGRDPYIALTDSAYKNILKITREGISNADNNANHVYATDGSIADLTQYANAAALNNYVLTTALDKQVDTLNAAISGKQDAGNYIPFEKRGLNDERCYIIAPSYYIECRTDKFDNGKYNYSHIGSQYISVNSATGGNTTINMEGINIDGGGNASNDYNLQLSPNSISSRSNSSSHFLQFKLSSNGLELEDGRDNKVLTSNGSTIDINQYVLKSVYDEKIAALEARIAALEAKHTETA